jgi:hypothetical protein
MAQANKAARVLTDALERVALASSTSNPVELAAIASEALRAFHEFKEYRITARTWWGRSGCEYRGELRDMASGNIVFSIAGTGSGWDYAMRDRMAASGLFPAADHENMNATLYFREVAGVDYEHAEVSRKRDL